MKVRDVLKLIEQDGWRLDRTKGSHRQYPSGQTRDGHGGRASLRRVTAGNFEQRSKAIGIEAVKYTVLYEKSGTGYSAYVPDLQGCVAAAKTLDKTKQLIREAIEMHIERLKQHGEPIPQPTTVSDSITVSA
jgi:predicted RNase H-like HicB family nuclease